MRTTITPDEALDAGAVAAKVDAFRMALEEVPTETAVAIGMLIESIARYLHNMGHPRMLSTAREHATLVAAQLVNDGRFDILIILAVTGQIPFTDDTLPDVIETGRVEWLT